jgi:hypothetical protein
MTDHSGSAMDAISGAASSKVSTITATTTASGVIVSGAQPHIFGYWLAENGVGLLSWIEIFQIIGSLYVTAQLIKLLISTINHARENIMPKKPVKPTVVVTTPTAKPKKTKA